MHLLSGVIMYASPIWRHNVFISYLAPSSKERACLFGKDSKKSATKFILGDFSSQIHLTNLIDHYISMSTTTTRSSSHLKIKHVHLYSVKYLHSIFPCMARLRNSLPSIDLSISLGTVKTSAKLIIL